MTPTFLGKWTICYPKQPDAPFITYDGYAAYTVEPGGDKWPVEALCLWYIESPQREPYPPGKETSIAFLLRSDGQLCFLMNNGQYVALGQGLPFVSRLGDAVGFAFPGLDSRNLPTPFSSLIKELVTNTYIGPIPGFQYFTTN